MTTLGATYRDKITGFEGVATGYVQYITGCNQVLLAPTLDNGTSPGFDKAAPRR